MSTTTNRRTKVSKREHESPAANLPFGNRLRAASPNQISSSNSQNNDTAHRRLTFARRTAVVVWACVVAYRTLTSGFAFNRELLLVYIVTGLMTASTGDAANSSWSSVTGSR